MAPAPSNREQTRATTVDCSSERSPHSSEMDGDDGDDCWCIDEGNEDDICSVVF